MLKENSGKHLSMRLPDKMYNDFAERAKSYSMPLSAYVRAILAMAIYNEHGEIKFQDLKVKKDKKRKK